MMHDINRLIVGIYAVMAGASSFHFAICLRFMVERLKIYQRGNGLR